MSSWTICLEIVALTAGHVIPDGAKHLVVSNPGGPAYVVLDIPQISISRRLQGRRVARMGIL